MTEPATGATGGEPQKSWTEGLDAETKGYLQTRGLDKKTPIEAVFETSKAHREATKLIGAPENEIIRLPKDPAAPEWKNIWNRLGTPLDAKDYDFSAIKRSGDKPMDEALATTIRAAAHQGNLPKASAELVATAIAKHLDSIDATNAAVKAENLIKEKATLKSNWGANEAANMVVARAAATALGVDPGTVAALEGAIGYAKTMEMFRLIGTKIGEDRFVTSSGSPAAGGAMTRDQAVAEKNALKNDTAWVKRYLAGGREEKMKMDALDRIIHGVAA